MTTDNYEELLRKFIKSNKQARLRKAQALGYKSAEEYVQYLKNQIKAGISNTAGETPKKTKSSISKSKKTIHHVYLIDRSGSMNWPSPDKMKAAIDGVNNDINSVKKNEDANHIITLADFDNVMTYHHTAASPSDVTTFNARARAATALYSSLGAIIELALSIKADNTLVKVFTDGGENATPRDNKYHGGEALKKLISRVEEENNFTVTFIGTEEDCIKINQNLNIDLSNMVSHNNTSASVSMAFAAMDNATEVYSKSVSRGMNVTKGFYKKA